MNPITSISAVNDILLPTGQVRKRELRENPYAGIPPFWQQAHERMSAAGSDHAKFRLLTQMAQESRALPPPGDYLPPEILLNIPEEEVKEWARDQPPGVRGRMYRIMQGINMLPPWPYYVLQNEGRFDPQWQRDMTGAAERYIRLVRADRDAVALLRQDIGTLARDSRKMLVTRLVGHASAALQTPMAEVRLYEKAPDGRDNDKDAEARFEKPVKINFYPNVFARGSVNLVVTVFHETMHAQQMHLITAAMDEQEGRPSRPLNPEQSGRAAVLELSMLHLNAIQAQPQRDHHYYLYRYATEAEREAHVAELAAAMLAAECAEFNPDGAGSLARIRAAAAGSSSMAYDPEAQVTHYVKEKTGFDATRVGELAANALTASTHCMPAMQVLASRQQFRNIQGAVLRRIVESGGFEATFNMLVHRAAAAPALAQVQPAQGNVSDRRPRAVRRGRGSKDASAELWSGLLNLQQLRDPLDTSDMLSHALLSGAPKLFYGRSDEAQFLRTVIISALAPARPELNRVVRKHLERRFGCKFGQPASSKAWRTTIAALQRAWFTYRSALSRKIIFEVAANELGISTIGGKKTRQQAARRTELRRAIRGLSA